MLDGRQSRGKYSRSALSKTTFADEHSEHRFPRTRQSTSNDGSEATQGSKRNDKNAKESNRTGSVGARKGTRETRGDARRFGDVERDGEGKLSGVENNCGTMERD